MLNPIVVDYCIYHLLFAVYNLPPLILYDNNRNYKPIVSSFDVFSANFMQARNPVYNTTLHALIFLEPHYRTLPDNRRLKKNDMTNKINRGIGKLQDDKRKKDHL